MCGGGSGEVENFAWCSFDHLRITGKFCCVREKDIDERTTIAKLEVRANDVFFLSLFIAGEVEGGKSSLDPTHLVKPPAEKSV